MTEETVYLELADDKIINLDADERGNFIAFTHSKAVITNEHKLFIDVSPRFPVVRRLNQELFLIADGRTAAGFNGHIYNFSGEKIHSFLIGDGIEDIVVHREKIIVTYFDEGVSGAEGPNNDGVAVFGFDGKQIFGFNSASTPGYIIDCYGICKYGADKVLFYAYTSLNVYELNLDSFKVQEYDTPKDFKGASSMSAKENKIIFHSSYFDKTSFFTWDRNKNKVTKTGGYASKLKGLQNGKFLAFGERGYTIISPSIS